MATALAPRQPTLWGDAPIQVRPVVSPVGRLDDHSFVLHQPDWLQGSDAAFDEILARTEWRSLRRPMYDRIIDVPRLIATVTGADLVAGSALDVIIAGVVEAIGIDRAGIGQIGLNLYRDGADSVAWHRDRVGQARDWTVVALVSLGGPRELLMRPFGAASGRGRGHRFRLQSGDLFVMGGACQRAWEHTVPKAAAAAPRISIAIRTKQFPQGPLLQHTGVTP